MSTLEFIEKHKVISICRKIYGDDLLALAEALNRGGLKLMEITFDQIDPDCIKKTTDCIRTLKQIYGTRMRFGAGTVLTKEQVNAAADAGAEYIISPNVDSEVIKATKDRGLVSIPGAMTPTEILAAHNLGADVVKLFPSLYLGFGYIKDILGPISHVKLCATGGVTLDNAQDFLNYGFVALGVGGYLSDKKIIADKKFEVFTERARLFAKMTE